MQPPDDLFEPDISSRVRRDFVTDANTVFQQLLTFCRDHQDLAESRIIRCIVHAAQGRLTGINHYIGMACSDPRDVILTAEYQTRPGTKRWQGIYDQIHNFRRPFPE